MRVLTRDEARQVYDRIGAKQDSQAFYEDVATEELIRLGEFGSARSVFELGCGTGRFAEKLLTDHLPPEAKYRAVDLSETMVGLAKGRLSRFEDRAQVILSDGSPPTSEPTAAYDRFVSNFVLDLLSESDIRAVLAEAARMLEPGGFVCLCSLAPGRGAVSGAVSRVWSWVHRLSPKLVGGCRPLELAPFFGDGPWEIRHLRSFAPYGLSSEVVIAERRR